MRCLRISLLGAVCYGGMAMGLAAQSLNLPMQQRGTVGLQLLATPGRPTGADSSRGSRFTSFVLSGSLPLYQRATLDSHGLRLRVVQLQGQLGLQGIDVPGFADRAFYTIQLGGSLLYSTSRRGMLMGSVGAFVAEDASSLQRSQPRWLGLAGYAYMGENLGYVGGLAFSYLYGDGLLLPWLGLRVRLSPQATLLFNLPYSTQYLYKNERGWRYRVFLRGAGGLLRAGTDAGDVFIRRREVLLGGGVGRRAQQWQWQVQAGLSIGRRIWVRDAQQNELASLTPRGTAFISASVRYTLRSRTEAADAAAISDFLLEQE